MSLYAYAGNWRWSELKKYNMKEHDSQLSNNDIMISLFKKMRIGPRKEKLCFFAAVDL